MTVYGRLGEGGGAGDNDFQSPRKLAAYHSKRPTEELNGLNERKPDSTEHPNRAVYTLPKSPYYDRGPEQGSFVVPIACSLFRNFLQF